MTPWIDSIYCQSRHFCARCRDVNNNAFWQSTQGKFLFPDNRRDFACPYGIMPSEHTAHQPPAKPRALSAPSWGAMRSVIAKYWPDWLPEIDGAILAAVGCTPCQDAARRRRWQERIAAALAL